MTPTRGEPETVGRRLTRRSRAGLLWCLLFFVAAQLALTLLMDSRRPELRDPEYGYKLAQLRSRLANEPGRPLVLALGSSRLEVGLRPEELVGGDHDRPIVFNFGCAGGGCFRSLLTLRRLQAEGIRPDWVLLEIVPLYLDRTVVDTDLVPINHLTLDELALACRFGTGPGTKRRDWWLGRLVPWYSHRFCFLGCYARDWLPDIRRWYEYRIWTSVDRSGWLTYSGIELPDPEFRRQALAVARQTYQKLGFLHPGGQSSLLLEELLTACQQQGIRVAFLLMPESDEFRSWYSAEGLAELDATFTRLSRTYNAPVLDARTWMREEDFRDGHHLTYRGAAAFTERFGREALWPLLREELTPGGPAAVKKAIARRDEP